MYGALKALNYTTINEIINRMIDVNALERTVGEYPLLRPGRCADGLENGSLQITLNHLPQPASESRKASGAAPKPARGSISAQNNGKLYQHLVAVRKEIALKKGIAAYMVFNDSTLSEMAKERPHTEAEFIRISGVGQKKNAVYGELFRKVIADWEKQNRDC